MGAIQNLMDRVMQPVVDRYLTNMGYVDRLGGLPYIDLRTGEKAYPMGSPVAYYSNAFRACLLAKARPISSLPVGVYTRERGGVRTAAEDGVSTALERIMRTRWNPYMLAGEGVRWALMTKDTLGEAFVRVEWDRRAGVPVALWPMHGQPRVLTMADGTAGFEFAGDSMTPAGTYLSHEVVWLKSPVIDEDGVHGLSLAELAAGELGLSIDLEDFYQRLLRNGNHFPGWLEAPNSMKPEEIAKLKGQLDDGGGVVNAGRVRIFDNGMTYHQTPLTMKDMSLVEQETWILQQTCRTLSVPPQEVFDLSHATYSNVEQGALSFATKTLVPECHALEQALNTVLWSAGLTDGYVSFDLNGMLRGSYRDRIEGYRIGLTVGLWNKDECRGWEDMQPYEGGQYYMQPSAYALIDPETGEIIPTNEPSASDPRPGGSGETGDTEPYTPADALDAIHSDMETRIAQRFKEKGACPASRDFAAKVLAPFAEACLRARIEYDIDQDIEDMEGRYA